MGLLGDVYSYGDGLKRKLRGLLDDPGGTFEQMVGRFGDDQRGLLNLQSNAFPMAGERTVLNSPQQIAGFRKELADKGAEQAMAGAISRAEKMANMGMERGWYRGGPKPNEAGNRTGPWYTQDSHEAAGYAKGRGDDVREYAIPSSGFFTTEGRYPNLLPNDVAKIISDPYYGKKGEALAKDLMSYGPGEGITGGQLWQSLKANFGNDDAAAVLEKLGKFKGAKGLTHGPEAYVFKNAPVRDAEKAAFDPLNYGKDDIYGKANPSLLGLLGGTALGGSYLLHKD